MIKKRLPESENSAMAGLRNRLAVIAWLLGGAAGAARGYYGQGQWHPLIHGLVGWVLATAGMALGGGLGTVLGRLRRGHESSAGEDTVGGMTLGGMAGCFCGLVIAAVAGLWSLATIVTAAGGFVGAFLGCFFNDVARVALRMLLHDSQKQLVATKEPDHLLPLKTKPED